MLTGGRRTCLRDLHPGVQASDPLVPGMPNRPLARVRNPDQRREAGQGLAEFALIIPILFMMVVAISDFGRLYTSMVAVESAAREAADYGSFKANYWTAANASTTAGEMERWACTAAAGSHLDDYQEVDGTVDHATCTNPAMTCQIEPSDGSSPQPCATYDGIAGACSESTTEPPCTVHVRLSYTFRTFLSIPPLPATVDFERHGLFRISDLPVPTAAP